MRFVIEYYFTDSFLWLKFLFFYRFLKLKKGRQSMPSFTAFYEKKQYLGFVSSYTGRLEPWNRLLEVQRDLVLVTQNLQ